VCPVERLPVDINDVCLLRCVQMYVNDTRGGIGFSGDVELFDLV